jgi:hypothetical protein
MFDTLDEGHQSVLRRGKRRHRGHRFLLAIRYSRFTIHGTPIVSTPFEPGLRLATRHCLDKIWQDVPRPPTLRDVDCPSYREPRPRTHAGGVLARRPS